MNLFIWIIVFVICFAAVYLFGFYTGRKNHAPTRPPEKEESVLCDGGEGQIKPEWTAEEILRREG